VAALHASEANIKAKPALIEFDNILARADALLTQVPVRADLSEHEITTRYYRERALPHLIPHPIRQAPRAEASRSCRIRSTISLLAPYGLIGFCGKSSVIGIRSVS
jgi:hypothetical protein